jgi:hypothetical protein
MLLLLSQEIELLAVVLQQMGADTIPDARAATRDNVNFAYVETVNEFRLDSVVCDLPDRSGISVLGSNLFLLPIFLCFWLSECTAGRVR